VLEVTGLDVERVAALMAQSGLRLRELTPHRASLEDAFMELTRDAVEFFRGAAVTRAVHAEWTKLRSVRSTPWSLAGIVALTLAVGVISCATSHTEGGSPGAPGDDDVVLISLAGILLGQVAAVVLGTFAIGTDTAPARSARRSPRCRGDAGSSSRRSRWSAPPSSWPGSSRASRPSSSGS